MLDKWILSKMTNLENCLHKHMQNYELFKIVPDILKLIDDLTNIYIRLNRSRFWQEEVNQDKTEAYSVLYEVLLRLSMCMAPFAPFISDWCYRELRNISLNKDTLPESVHLCQYKQSQWVADSDLEQAVSLLQDAIVLTRQIRNEERIKIKIPLKRLTIINRDKAICNIIKKFEETIKKELNIQVCYDNDEQSYISYIIKPNSPILGKKYGAQFGKLAKLIRNMDIEQLNHLEKNGTIQLEEFEISENEVIIDKKAKEIKGLASLSQVSVLLDLEIDQNAVDMGLVREIINRVQKTRKSSLLEVSDRIQLVVNCDKKLKDLISQYNDHIKQETLSVDISFTDLDLHYRYEIDDYIIKLETNKL